MKKCTTPDCEAKCFRAPDPDCCLPCLAMLISSLTGVELENVEEVLQTLSEIRLT